MWTFLVTQGLGLMSSASALDTSSSLKQMKYLIYKLILTRTIQAFNLNLVFSWL